MKIRVVTPLISLLGLTISLNVAAQSYECETIRCDCASLSSKALQSLCSEREELIQSACKRHVLTTSDTCGFYGTEANWGPNTTSFQIASAPKAVQLAQLKWQASYQSLLSRIAQFEAVFATGSKAVVHEDLQQIQNQVDALFQAQDTLASAQSEWMPEALSASWSQFAEALLGTAKAIELAEQQLAGNAEKATLVSQLIHVKSALYEQVGYGLNAAGRQQEAAMAWKQSAEWAAQLMIEAEKKGDKAAAYEYRYLQSIRLHKAREYWRQITVQR